jgi:oligopeptidase B
MDPENRMNYGPGVLRPPIAPSRPASTEFHGEAVTDPYAWIADPDDPEVAAVLAAEREYHDARVQPLAALRAELAAEMAARVPAQEDAAGWEQGGFRYGRSTLPGTEYDRIVRRPLDAPEAGDSVLLDLQAEHEIGGTSYSRDGLVEVSPDGRWLAWSIDVDGDEVYVLRFRDLTTGTDLDEVVPRSYYGGAWSADSSSFLYTVHDEAYRPYQVWRHVLGTPVVDDTLVFEDLDERLELTVDPSRSGEWITITLLGRGFTEQWLLPAADVTSSPRLVRGREVDVEYDLTHAGDLGGGDCFLVTTNLGAPEFHVMQAMVDDPSAWTVFLEEDPAQRVWGVDAFAHGLVVTLRRDGAQRLRVLPRDGSAFEIVSDVAGGMARLGRNEDWNAPFVTVELESFVHPEETYDVSWSGGRALRHRRESLGVDLSAYVCERLMAPADGVDVPVIVMRHRDTALDGSAPCLLYGYGSYEASCDPDWGIDWWRSVPSLLDRGVVFAVGHPRGGGEMGRRWWVDGHLGAKANTFDDQAAVAEHLLDGRVRAVVTRGLSAGGLLQGALYGRRPDLFAGVIAEVPFVDVVTAMLDETLPLTAQEWLEWGDPRIPQQYQWLSAYSPMLHLPDVADRPPLLVTGAVHDPRVLVREPARWVSRLRASDPAAGEGDDPSSPVSPRTVLFRVETGAGAHAGPSGRYAELEYEAEVYAWALRALGAA